MFDCSQITVIGTGLLGASVGLALKRTGYRGTIVGLGRREETLKKAHSVGGLDHWTTDYAQGLKDSELAIVAVPLSAFETVFEQIGSLGPDDMVVTDVGSTKTPVHAAAKANLAANQRFVGSHPMAGSEHQGPDAARADLFDGKPCIVTKDGQSDRRACELIVSLWQTLHMRTIRMSAHEHDEKSAVISHLPHAAAVMLVQLACDLGGWEIASTGFQDTTRLASSNPPMRADILMANRQQVSHALAQYGKRIDQLRQVLDQGDHAALLNLLQTSQAARAQWLNGDKSS